MNGKVVTMENEEVKRVVTGIHREKQKQRSVCGWGWVGGLLFYWKVSPSSLSHLTNTFQYDTEE